MNLAVILKILVQISTSASDICNNDTTKKMQGLHISDNDSETTDYACTSTNENIIKRSANPNNHETDTCVDVDDCETKETDVANQVDRNLKKPNICKYEENKTVLSTYYEYNGYFYEEPQIVMFPVVESSSSSSLSEPESPNYCVRSGREISNQNDSKTCDKKIIKVGFSTDEIIEFIKAKKEKIIYSEESKPSFCELQSYFSFFQKRLKGFGKFRTLRELCEEFTEYYIKARKERMIFYNTYEICESKIKDLIKVKEMKPCYDRIKRDKSVAKKIISLIQQERREHFPDQYGIRSNGYYKLYVQFYHSIFNQYYDNGDKREYLLTSEGKELGDLIRFELKVFNAIVPSDEEIEAFVKDHIKLTDNGEKNSKLRKF